MNIKLVKPLALSIQSNLNRLNSGLGDTLLAMADSIDNLTISNAFASLIYRSIPIENLPVGGVIDLESYSSDQRTAFLVHQTTASKTISLPNPSDSSVVRTVYLVNTGSVAFSTAGGISISPGKAHSQLWTGSAWVDLI